MMDKLLVMCRSLLYEYRMYIYVYKLEREIFRAKIVEVDSKVNKQPRVSMQASQQSSKRRAKSYIIRDISQIWYGRWRSGMKGKRTDESSALLYENRRLGPAMLLADEAGTNWRGDGNSDRDECGLRGPATRMS